MPEEERQCDCGHVLRVSEGRGAPVHYDPVYNEFEIAHRGRAFRMLYCFNCGGKLPDSFRGRRVTIPSESDSADAARVMHRCRTAADVLRELGPGDSDETWNLRRRRSRVSWRRQFSYRKRWETLVLVVIEYTDGSLSFGINGQAIDPEKL